MNMSILDAVVLMNLLGGTRSSAPASNRERSTKRYSEKDVIKLLKELEVRDDEIFEFASKRVKKRKELEEAAVRKAKEDEIKKRGNGVSPALFFFLLLSQVPLWALVLAVLMK